MTKEGILLECVGLRPYEFPKDLVLKAMDEYGKKEAVEFAEWCAETGWEKYIGEKTWFNRMGYVTEYTTEQLYTLYKSSQKND